MTVQVEQKHSHVNQAALKSLFEYPLLSALRICEEGIEMIAMAIMLFAALRYLRLRTSGVRIAVS